MSPSSAGSGEGAWMDWRGSEKKMRWISRPRTVGKTHVWNERNGVHWGHVYQRRALLVWMQCARVLAHCLLLCLPLSTVSNIKECHDGENHQWDNRPDNT